MMKEQLQLSQQQFKPMAYILGPYCPDFVPLYLLNDTK